MKKTTDQGTQSGSGSNVNIFTIVKGIAISYVVTIPIFLVFALILSYTDFPEKLVTPVVVATTVISVLIAGIMISKKSDSNGWLNGGIVGFIYMAVLYILSSILYHSFTIDRYAITMTIIGILTGAIGGILGVNMKSKTKSKKRYGRV